MFEKLGVQLYTVREYLEEQESTDKALAMLAELGYSEVHVASSKLDGKTLGGLLKKHGMTAVGTHYDLRSIYRMPEETIAHHRALNTTNIGIGSLPVPARTELEELKKFIKRYNEAAELYAKEGFKLTYHNHQFEFMRIDKTKTIMDILYEELDPDNISFVLDTCWVAAGAGDVTAWLEKLKGRIDILHLKDAYLRCADNVYTVGVAEVGNGNLAWDNIIAKAEEVGVKHYVVEQDNGFCGTPFDSLAVSAEFLAKYRY